MRSPPVRTVTRRYDLLIALATLITGLAVIVVGVTVVAG